MNSYISEHLKKFQSSDFWKEHELIIKTYKAEDGSVIMEHHLKRPDSYMDSVRFTNHDVLSITGDYGNWIFDRRFMPSPNTTADPVYWLQKLRLNSEQSFPIDVRDCIEAYREDYKDVLENKDDYGEKTITLWKEFMEELEDVEDEHEYVNIISDYVGDLFDEPHTYKKIPIHFYIVLEAYNEICRRLTEQQQNGSK